MPNSEMADSLDFNKTLLAHIDSLDALSSPNKENTDETSKEQSRIQNAVKVYRSICDDETKRVNLIIVNWFFDTHTF
jgi:hypothetical protein